MTMNASDTRAHHIDTAKRNLQQIIAASAVLRANTAKLGNNDWNWVDDWKSISAKLAEVAYQIESAAKVSEMERVK